MYISVSRTDKMSLQDEGELVPNNDASIDDITPAFPFFLEESMLPVSARSTRSQNNFVSEVPVVHPGKANSAPGRYGSEVSESHTTNTNVTYAVVNKNPDQAGNSQTLPMPTFFQRNENLQRLPKRYLRGLPKSASLPRHVKGASNVSNVPVILQKNAFQEPLPDMAVAPKFHNQTFYDSAGITQVPVRAPLMSTPPGAPTWRWEEASSTAKRKVLNKHRVVFDTSVS